LLTTRLASLGNLEAYFLAGLCLIFVEAHRSMKSLMEWLQHSIKVGYKLGMYVYALMLYRSNTDGGNDDIARCLLRELEGADEAGPAALPWKNQTFSLFRRDMYWRLQDMMPHDVVPGLHPVHHQDRHHQCIGCGCGESVGFEV
jgi:hypothetical protein